MWLSIVPAAARQAPDANGGGWRERRELARRRRRAEQELMTQTMEAASEAVSVQREELRGLLAERERLRAREAELDSRWGSRKRERLQVREAQLRAELREDASSGGEN